MKSGTFFLVLAQLIFLLHKTTGYGHQELGDECEPIKTRFIDDPNRIPPASQQFIPQDPNSNTRTVHGTSYVNNYVYPAHSSPIPEGRKCRSEQGLYCDEWSRRCKCHEHSGSIYNYETRRCELAIDNFCTTKIVDPIKWSGSTGEDTGIDYEHFCPEYASCTCNYHHLDRKYWTKCQNENGLCKCDYGYRPEDDLRACYYSKGQVISVSWVGLGLVPLLGAWIHYWHIV